MPKHVADRGRVGIEPDIPSEIDVAQFPQRLDVYVNADHMRDPEFHCFCQRVEPFAPGGQIERHIEPVAAFPIATGIVAIDNVDISLGWNAKHLNQRRYRPGIAAAHCLFVGCKQRTFMQRDTLGAEKQFRGTQHTRILHVIKRIAQNDVHQLIHEQWRDVANAVSDQCTECSFERFMPQQVIAKIDQKPPVFARIGVSDRRNVRS